jgi:phage-related baseplate assembly protein|nr:MAG TPA_asm: baseplate assembly protein [Caudoviricetes sp.]
MTEDIISEIEKLLDYKSSSSDGDITFVETDMAKIQEQLINLYTTITDRTLAAADPIRLFLNCIAYVIIMQRNSINYSAKMNLLRYAVNTFLDEIGYNIGVDRLPATKAVTTIKITLSKQADTTTIIPKGIRVTPGDDVFFELVDNATINIGETTTTAKAQCTIAGSIGNGYMPGQINKIVDRLPFTADMVNTTTTEGGTDVESDDAYRERIHLAPEKFSTAGPIGAYEYWAKSASTLINDVLVNSPSPGVVNIYVLLKDGELPEEELINQVEAVCNDDKIRPLTDEVKVLAPETVNYQVNLTYWISKDDQYQEVSLKEKIEKAVQDWILWTKSRIGRDINPSELIRKMVVAGAKRVDVVSPVYTKVLNGKYQISSHSVDSVQVAILEGKANVAYGGLEDD